jgi:hypothetical protein
MDTTPHYKDYVIRPFLTNDGKWKAEIRKADGSPIKILVPEDLVDSRTMPTECVTADEAIRLAKQLIDGGGMS